MNFGPRPVSAWLSIGLLAGGLWLALHDVASAKDEKNPPVRIEIDKTPIPREGKFTSSFSHVVKKVSPSVVKVYSTVKSKIVRGRGGNPLLDDPTLRRFFGDDFGGNGGDRRNYRTPREQGLGSGVVISKDGYILTNNHVVENADEIKVSVGEEEKDYIATVIGRDDKTDIAVLKIDASDLTPITTTDSDAIEVGDIVLAVGNPFGIGQTVTMGLVSATGRSALGLHYENFIQTDAPINPGNSGGALVDSQGRLIGINTAILSRTGGNQGIGFAVPINLARFVMESIVKDGRVVRGFMGVHLQPMTPALARQFKLGDSSGAMVAEVQPNTPAAKAGLKDGDIILELDGRPVKDSHSLRLQVSQTAPGTKISLKVVREGEKRKVDIVLKELPDNLAASNEKEKSGSKSDALDGVTVGDLDKATRNRLSVPAEVKGVVVTAIEENSASAEAGLKVGDIIREINRHPVTTAEEAVDLSEKIKEDTVLLRVWTPDGNGHGTNRYVVVQEEKRK
ncbi:MAG: Do family serine endopeptidase [Verrucomicrobia bacterium]|nr:Do family serine endopeptidase [Verrucomicrobiota bacterium]